MTAATVLSAVRRAPAVRVPPGNLSPAGGLGFDNERCETPPAADRIEPCVFGDRASATDVVLYGDSQAGMWLPAMIEIAERRHWRLQFLGKPACPTPAITFWHQRERRSFGECDRFRAFATGRIAAIRPELVVVADGSFAQRRGAGVPVTPAAWQAGLTHTLRVLRRAARNVLVLGDLPVLAESAPECLAARRDVMSCSTSLRRATERVWHDADAAAARTTGAGYLSVLPWLCTALCTPVIGDVVVYRHRFQLTGTYARLLNGVLEEALDERFPQVDVP